MPSAHEGHSLGWRACQMASYCMSRTFLVVLPWSLRAISQWRDEHWPLSFNWASSLRWAHRCQASWAMLLGRLRGPLPPSLRPCTPPRRPSCPHFIMCWLGGDCPVRWLWSSNLQRCLSRRLHHRGKKLLTFLANLYLVTWPRNSAI